MKNIKTKTQSKALYESANLAVECMKYISTKLVLGVSEFNVARKVRTWFKKHGATKLAFPTIVAYSENASNPHHHPSKTRLLKPTDLVVIDMGCVYKGYCSDITRTFLPKKPTKKMLEVYAIVKQVQVQAIKKAKAGMKACSLDKIARDIISSYGYGQYFIHTTGHGIGKVVHEGFRIGPKDDTILVNNMFFTIEPGIYIPNEFGIRVEDTITLVNNKADVLTKGISK